MAAPSATTTRRSAHRVAGMSRPRTHRKVSVKLPVEILDDIEERVGPSNVSRYLAEALADGERRRALREWLDEAEAEHGPISPDAVEKARQAWHGAIADQ